MGAFEAIGAMIGRAISDGVALWANIAAGNRNKVRTISLKVLTYCQRIRSKGEPGPNTNLVIIETKGLE